MKCVITSELVEAYLQCQRKAFFMLRGHPKAVQHEYEQILTERACANRNVYLDSFTTLGSSSHDLIGTLERCQNGSVEAMDLRADCDAISQQTRKEEKTHVPHEPHLVVGTHSVTKEHRFRLAFAGFVIGEMRRYRPKMGIIIPVSGKPHRIRLDSLYPAVRTTIADLRTLFDTESPKSPPLILNENCSTCPFRQHCSQEAEEADSLCLLDRMTPKLIRKYQAKGIFTVTQLSYLFKPRRRRKRKSQPPPTFNLELQALALRTGKIYLNDSPSIPENPVELFLDIEGIPDENFHYLIGLLVKDHDRTTEHCFWADSQSDEQSIFEECFNVATRYGDAPIYHYGSYEPGALLRAAKEHGIKCNSLVDRLVNVNSWIFGRVYFPSRSNGLKDLGPLLGATWDSPDASGLQSLVWRYRWEDTRCEELKQQLIEYNRNDCHALRLLVVGLREIGNAAQTREDIDFADSPKQAATDRGAEIHEAFENVLASAHAEYRRSRIRVRQRPRTSQTDECTRSQSLKGHPCHRRIVPSKAGKTLRVRRRLKCSAKHRGEQHSLERTGRDAEQTVIDLAFTKNGCRKTTTKYVGEITHCPRCKRDLSPPSISRLKGRLFGHRFQAWAMYQRVVLRLPYAAIADVIDNLFSEHVTPSCVVNFVRRMSDHYAPTERLLLKHILASPFVHVDETPISIRGVRNYVWVFTNGTHVVFRLTETRETTFVRKMLADFKGVLVSDFYPGYDSVKCRQQKCLVHLIRDLNDDLWKNPFNKELESFVASIRDVLVPMLGDAEKYGLKTRHLHKHEKVVDRFYKYNVDGGTYRCDIVSRYQKRFQRYRDSLFLFLQEDGIPWNNNFGERAIRHLAVQRKISGSFHRPVALQYLRLLGIAQTCRFQEKSFLRFLLSEQKDVDRYKERRRPKPSRIVPKRQEDEHQQT